MLTNITIPTINAAVLTALLPESEVQGRLGQIIRGETDLPLDGPHSRNSYRKLLGYTSIITSRPAQPRYNIGASEAERTAATELAFACVHRGAVIRHDESNLCSSKGQQTAIHACTLHGECSLTRYCQQQEVRQCGGCEDRKEPPGPGQLIGVPIDRSKLQSHILYHVMPLAGDAEWVWRRHMTWLREVRPQFNGRLIVGIVTPGPNDEWSYLPPDAVRESLAGLDAEFVEAPNDVKLNIHRQRDRRAGRGEGVLFPLMLGRLQTSDPNQVAFYGHCKGVARADHLPGSAPHKWAEVMFETLFRNYSAAIEALDTKGICGPLFMRGGFLDGQPGLCSVPFFSGTFFAMRLADVFARNWRRMPSAYGCVERWPQGLFDLHTEAQCLFFDGVTNLYDEAYWRNVITPAFTLWQAIHSDTSKPVR